jgi:hypothetical protein
MNKVQLFQDRILTDAEQLALAAGAAAYRWEDLTKAPISPSVLLNPRRYGELSEVWIEFHARTPFHRNSSRSAVALISSGVLLKYQ